MLEFIIGISVGIILYYIFGNRKEILGVFVLDFSDPMKDVCRLELFHGPWSAYNKKYITLKVQTIGDIEKDDSPN